MVLKTEDLIRFIGKREGLIEMEESKALSMLKRAFFMNRDLVEENEDFKQVIPYTVFVHKGRVLLMKRTERQSESRLHGKYTLGVGGHVREEDGEDPLEAFRNGMVREIREEIDAEIENFEFVGLINHNGNPVSRVHIGYLYMAKGVFKDVREKDNFEWKLVDLEELESYERGMEEWSRIALTGLKYILPLK